MYDRGVHQISRIDVDGDVSRLPIADNEHRVRSCDRYTIAPDSSEPRVPEAEARFGGL
jgi:hypothetical protein